LVLFWIKPKNEQEKREVMSEEDKKQTLISPGRLQQKRIPNPHSHFNIRGVPELDQTLV
jgi:hypothetical protein